MNGDAYFLGNARLFSQLNLQFNLPEEDRQRLQENNDSNTSAWLERRIVCSEEYA